MEQAIYDACAFLAEGSHRGHTRPDLTPRSLRFWTLSCYPNYTVFYRPATAPPVILTPNHRDQDPFGADEQLKNRMIARDDPVPPAWRMRMTCIHLYDSDL